MGSQAEETSSEDGLDEDTSGSEDDGGTGSQTEEASAWGGAAAPAAPAVTYTYLTQTQI